MEKMLSIESTAHWLRPTNLLAKRAGERSAGNLHAPFGRGGGWKPAYGPISEALPEETGSNR